MRIEDLPTLNACLNAASALLIMAGYLCIKRKNVSAHIWLMSTAVVVSMAFLTSYVIYHTGVEEEKKFQGEGWIRYVYFAMLISHIVLAFVVVPLVLRTVYLGMRNRLEKHVKIGPWTLAVWMYVSVTGVLIYLALY